MLKDLNQLFAHKIFNIVKYGIKSAELDTPPLLGEESIFPQASF
jgi:hypothetical protein